MTQLTWNEAEFERQEEIKQLFTNIVNGGSSLIPKPTWMNNAEFAIIRACARATWDMQSRRPI